MRTWKLLPGVALAAARAVRPARVPLTSQKKAEAGAVPSKVEAGKKEASGCAPQARTVKTALREAPGARKPPRASPLLTTLAAAMRGRACSAAARAGALAKAEKGPVLLPATERARVEERPSCRGELAGAVTVRR